MKRFAIVAATLIILILIIVVAERRSGRFPKRMSSMGRLILFSPTDALKRTGQIITGSPVPEEVMLDIATDSTDQHDAPDTEPSIAVNPVNSKDIAIASFAEKWTPSTGAPVWRTDDGGVIWHKDNLIPQITDNIIGPLDQQVMFADDGTLFLVVMGAKGGVFSDSIIHRDVARNISQAGSLFGYDMPMLTISHSAACPNTVYSSWLSSAHESSVTHSLDAGSSVSSSIAGDSFPNGTARTTATRTGKVYVAYKTIELIVDDTFQRVHYRIKRSDDCGRTWTALGSNGVSLTQEAQAVTYGGAFGNPAKGLVARAIASDLWIANSPSSDDVVAAYVDKRSGDTAQIFMASSSDNGVHWKSFQVSDGKFKSAFPEIAVSNLAIGVLYIDYDDSGDHTVFRHVFARSNDGGRTWNREVLQLMDPSGVYGAAPGFLWGDYEGLTATSDTFYGVFSGVSDSRRVRQLDPFFFVRRDTW
jgi:hypothetical protein